MPGPTTYNERSYPSLSEIAYRDDSGRWRAGKSDYGYQRGQFIKTRDIERADGTIQNRPADDIGRAYTMRQHANHVKSVMDRRDLGESEAREFINDKEQELIDAIERDAPPDEIIDIRRQLRGS